MLLQHCTSAGHITLWARRLRLELVLIEHVRTCTPRITNTGRSVSLRPSSYPTKHYKAHTTVHERSVHVGSRLRPSTLVSVEVEALLLSVAALVVSVAELITSVKERLVSIESCWRRSRPS